MTSLLSAELSATCNALGTFDKKTGKYLIDEYTLNTVKDLIRYLRRDGEEHEIRRHFGQTKVLQTDLIPMLVDHSDNDELFDVTLRLLVNLTNPALLLYREEVPAERTARHHYLQILAHQQSYKEEAFTKVDTWNIFAKKLAKILEIDWSERDEDTGLVIERILILIRNVLHVPADLDRERRPENDASVHDQVLWALNQSGILDIILYMSSENEKQYFMHIIEIISHLLREQNPSSLADAALQRSNEEKLKDDQELLMLRMNETKQRLDKVKQYSATRHSRFGGTYVVQNMKSISDNELISLKPLTDIASLDFSGSKKTRFVRAKNRRPLESGTMERRSAFAIRLFLKEFCIEFVNSSYNILMRHVKDVLVRAKAQQNDESYYLWAIKFFMEFNRGHRCQVGLVSETMSVGTFHFVQQQMEKYYEMIRVEKKKHACWVRRLHLALKAYKELLRTLMAMECSTDPTVKESAKVLKSNIFYVLEYREFVLNTFLNYDETKMPRSYLLDLVGTVHLFLKMLEHYCKKTGLVVQKKVRKKARTKKKASNSGASRKRQAAPPIEVPPWEEVRSQMSAVLSGGVSEYPPPFDAASDVPLDQQNSSASRKRQAPPPIEVPPWEEIRSQMSAVLSGGVSEYPPPFDAASEVPLDQQREDCVKKIQKRMREHKYEEAVGMFRAAREVWPEDGVFGTSDIALDEELEMLETIYKADLGIEPTAEAEPQEEINETEENSEYEDEEEEEEERSTAVVETDFDFPDFVRRFCHPRVVSACASVLERFDRNLPEQNHAALKMLHRIAYDCKMAPMMFQGTLFLVFQKVLRNPQPQFKELERFAIYILRQFTAAASKEPKVFIELLFWKTSKDAIEIEHGYDKYSDQRDKAGRGAWTEEQEDELRRLYMENQANPENDKDVIDWLLDNLIDQSRTRRGVIAKLKELGLIFKAPTKKSNKERANRDRADRRVADTHFTQEEDEMLASLWDEYKDATDPMSLVISRMPRKRSRRQIVDRMLELGVVKDRKECRKKRSKQAKSTPAERESSESNSESEEDSDRSRSPSPDGRGAKKMPAKKNNKKKDGGDSRKDRHVELTADQIARLLVEAVDEGLSGALSWLCECLEEVALDQEAEGSDGGGEDTPLVPIGAEAATAVDTPLFQRVLRGVGLVPPQDEQESYWRIPCSLHYSTIRKRREIIQKAIDGALILDDAAADTTNVRKRKRSDDVTEAHDEHNDVLAFAQRTLQTRQDSDDDDDSNELPTVNNSNDDGDDDDSRSNEVLSVNKSQPTSEVVETHKALSDIDEEDDIVSTKRSNKRRRILIEDDSD